MRGHVCVCAPHGVICSIKMSCQHIRATSRVSILLTARPAEAKGRGARTDRGTAANKSIGGHR